MKLPQQQQHQQQQIVSLNQDSSSSSSSNNNKLKDDVISQQQTSKETVVSASNAVAAELKGAPMLSIHDNDNSSNSAGIDGHFSHNTLDEYYKEPMYFGTENSTTVNTQIGANAHLPVKSMIYI